MREPLVLLHGVGADGGSWTRQMSAFGERYRVVAWNMPGYGDSERLSPMTFPALAEALESTFDDLSIDRAHVVGHSMGGMLAQEFAVTRQNRLLSLVLYATTPAFGNPAGQIQKKFLQARLGPLDAGGTMKTLAHQLMQGMLGMGADRDTADMASEQMARVPEDVYRAAVQCITTFEGRPHLETLRVPTLLLAAEKDRNAPPVVMERMAAKIHGSSFRCLPDAGHLAHLETPAAFNEAVLEFIDHHGET